MSILKKTYNCFFHPKVGEIWCLHRVLPVRSAFKSNRELEITPDYFEKIILEKHSQGFRFVDLDTFVASASGVSRKDRLINVSFDDGFADVFLYAYPIMKKYGIPFTLYVTTDMPDQKADLWWIQLEKMAQGDANWFEDIIRQVYESNKDIASTMHSITSSQKDLSFCSELAITWEQLRIMVSEGLCTIGSHGVSHSAMSLMSIECVNKELTDSRVRLKEMLGVDVRHFSYPHSMFNEFTDQCVWEAGYSTAVVGYGGATRRSKGKRFFYRSFVVQQ